MIKSDYPVSVTYTDAELRNIVEEYITQQKSEFTLKGVCSYVIYWTVEDDKVADANSIIGRNEIHPNDQKRVKHILDAIIKDGRITTASCCDTKCIKQ